MQYHDQSVAAGLDRVILKCLRTWSGLLHLRAQSSVHSRHGKPQQLSLISKTLGQALRYQSLHSMRQYLWRRKSQNTQPPRAMLRRSLCLHQAPCPSPRQALLLVLFLHHHHQEMCRRHRHHLHKMEEHHLLRRHHLVVERPPTLKICWHFLLK